MINRKLATFERWIIAELFMKKAPSICLVRPIILNLPYKVKRPHHENVCEFNIRILIIVNKRRKYEEPSIF